MKAAKLQKDGIGGYQVVDTRNGMILKRNISKIQKAAAYAEYYNQEIAKAEKEWGSMSRNIDVTRLIRWLNTSVLGPVQRVQLANYVAVESPTLDEDVCEIEACLSGFSKVSEKTSYLATYCEGVYSKEAIAKVRSTIDGLEDV